MRVVLTLLSGSGLEQKGYDLYVDRFYNSPLLATELLKIGITITGKYNTNYYCYIYLLEINSGTQMGNRKGLPESFKRKSKKAAVGTIKSFRSEDGKGSMLALTWTDKRRVLMLSTKHSNDTATVSSRYNKYPTVMYFLCNPTQ